jgi:hypothetical protein
MLVLMDEFCLQANCTWRDTFMVTQGPPQDKTWTNVAVWNMETYGISVGWWVSSAERMAKRVAFTQSWYDASIIMVTRKPNAYGETFDAWTWLTPFDDTVW